jgi:hypothetical protein
MKALIFLLLMLLTLPLAGCAPPPVAVELVPVPVVPQGIELLRFYAVVEAQP